MLKKYRAFMDAFAMCLSIGLCLFASANVSAEFQPNETQVSSQTDLIDPEYDQETSQFAWTDSAGNLWIGRLDSAGMFDPPSGKAILVDPYAMNTADLAITMNGPEWIQTNHGPQIVYTKFPAGQPHTANTARLAYAQLGSGGEWTYNFLSQTKSGFAPYGSKDINDVAPRTTYIDKNLRHHWREVNNAAKEEFIPLVPPSLSAVRFVTGTHSIVFSAFLPSNNTWQAFKYDVDTKVIEQLTFEQDGLNNSSSVWMWQAPEYNNEYVFLTTVYNANSTASALRIYRRIADNNGNPVWTNIHTVVAPLSRIGSPEPFIYDGHSYIFMQLATGTNQYSTSMWLANIDPANAFIRKITDDTLFRWRTDPEVFITKEGPYIYYNRRDPNDPSCNNMYCTEGIFRAYTGLSKK